VARKIEELEPLKANRGYEDIYKDVMEALQLNTQPATHQLDYPEPNTLYYEGMNRIVGGKYWLGLYWRNNRFSIGFLKALCQLCLDTDLGKISLTPWKSIIVKGIAEKDRLRWEKLLGKYGINIRHSSLELNWHLPVLDEEALELKNYLVRALDKVDISTYGLSFSIKTRHMVLFTSVAIEKNASGGKDGDSYNIMYARDFNPNGLDYIYYVKGVSREAVPPLLIELSYKYYDQLDIKKEEKVQKGKEAEERKKHKYQCTMCLTVYDEKLGDPASGVSPGTSFLSLPSNYCCPICESPKSAFKRI
jgi:rubredoxin